MNFEDENKILEEILEENGKEWFDISNDRRKMLSEKAESLSKDAHLEIFYYLKNKKVQYTLNANGVFIDINSIDDKTFVILEKKINFFCENEKKLKRSYDERLSVLSEINSGKKLEVKEKNSENKEENKEEKINKKKNRKDVKLNNTQEKIIQSMKSKIKTQKKKKKEINEDENIEE